jgi:hypothetical protein
MTQLPGSASAAPTEQGLPRRALKYMALLLLCIPVVPLLGVALAAGSSGSGTSSTTTAKEAPAPPAASSAGPRADLVPVRFIRFAPDITAGATPPHGPRGRCRDCHHVLQRARPVASVIRRTPCAATPVAPAAATLSPPPGRAGTLAMLPFQEAHWHGLELISLTPGIARILKIPRDASGVVVDEATMPADVQGFHAGDLVVEVEGEATTSLEGFVRAANNVRDRPSARIKILRKGQLQTLTLAAVGGRLGTANGETAPMIRSASRPPHGYMGPCTKCHHIGSGAHLAVDLGDPLTKTAPAIRAGARPPHANRGRCTACHVIK